MPRSIVKTFVWIVPPPHHIPKCLLRHCLKNLLKSTAKRGVNLWRKLHNCLKSRSQTFVSHISYLMTGSLFHVLFIILATGSRIFIHDFFIWRQSNLFILQEKMYARLFGMNAWIIRRKKKLLLYGISNVDRSCKTIIASCTLNCL